MKTVYLNLGSNMDDRAAVLRSAIEALPAAGIEVTRTSSMYETEPQDLRDQPWFLNLIAECRTALFPVQLLGRLKKLEARLGRKRIRYIRRHRNRNSVIWILYGRRLGHRFWFRC